MLKFRPEKYILGTCNLVNRITGKTKVHEKRLGSEDELADPLHLRTAFSSELKIYEASLKSQGCPEETIRARITELKLDFSQSANAISSRMNKTP